jgi:PEP-CTERM putative exosortase interaction domain
MKTKLLRIASSRVLSAAALCLAVAAPSASAALMIDLGSNTVGASDLLNSPLHAARPDFTESTWNSLTSSTTGAKTGLLYSDGTEATGVTVFMGRSSNNSWSTVTFAGAPTNVTSGTNPGNWTGVLSSATSIGRDGFYSAYASVSGDPATTRLASIAIGGLAAGTYEVYIVGLNPQLSPATGATMGFWATELSAVTATTTFDASALINGAPEGMASSTNSVSASWVEGANYAKLTVTVSSPDSFLTIVSLGLTEAETRGYLNAIQIVAIPEPSSAAVLAALGGLAFAATRRRRASA